MNATYKTYDPDGNAIFFTTIKEIREFFDMTSEEVRKCFYPGVHMLSNGVEIITFAN